MVDRVGASRQSEGRTRGRTSSSVLKMSPYRRAATKEVDDARRSRLGL